MIELSTKSLFFACMIIMAPFLLRYRSRIRQEVFLVMNILVITVASRSVLQWIITALWVVLPFVLMHFLGDRENLKPVMITGMVIVYIYLAKYGFVFSLLHLPELFLFKILGLSYFLFREIDYIMQYSSLKEEGYSLNLTDYLNYVLNFYTLMAGPILRYREFVDDFYRYGDEAGYIPITKKEMFDHINRVINGYVKVYVISAILDSWAKYWFDGLRDHSGFIKAAAAFCIFAFLNCWYIYFNFSGYCDIVIGAAGLSGMKIHENFNKPYLSRNVVEFWNRHHITLSEWIRDYIFTPFYKWLLSVPFKKKIILSQSVALFVTFLVAGIWHGTTIDYVMYGFFQGLGIVVASLWKTKRKKWLGKEKNKKYENNMAVITVTRIITWGYICLTFTFTGYPVMSLFINR